MSTFSFDEAFIIAVIHISICMQGQLFYAVNRSPISDCELAKLKYLWQKPIFNYIMNILLKLSMLKPFIVSQVTLQ